MHRSYPNSANSLIRGTLTLLALPVAIAIGAPLNTNAAAASGLPAVRSSPSPAGGAWRGPVASQDTTLPPDQKFLREASKGHAGMALLAHETLHRPGTFPSKADAKRLDQRVDDEMDRMRAALKSIFNDSSVAKPRNMAHVLTDSIIKLTGATYDSTYRKWVMEYDRLLILSIDRAVPKLTNADVKALAQKMRASASADMATLKTEQAAG